MAFFKNKNKIDKFFLTTLLIIVGVGVFTFTSASLGILAKNQNLFYSLLFTQLVLGLGLGLVGMYFTSRIPYKFWRKNALYILILALALTALVFVPGLSLKHGGAQRWLDIGAVSFQPAEILKFAFVIYFAAWLSMVKNKVEKPKYGIAPFIILLGIIGMVLLFQPDTKSFLLISVAGASMLYLSGVPARQLFLFATLMAVFLSLLVYFTPYLQERIKTFVDPSRDAQGASYQIQQSLIAIGSGGILGRGYGQSVQKFSYLPEAQGDSIFAVIGEEFGFLGTISVVLLFIVFVLRGMKIALNAPDLFSRLLVFGIVILIGAQAFMHIAAVIGILPLTGVPLPFMSHGGTSLLIYLSAIGIVFQISRESKNKIV